MPALPLPRMPDFKSLARRASAPILRRLDARSAHQARLAMDNQAKHSATVDGPAVDVERNQHFQAVFVPPVQQMQLDASAPFMQFSSCSAADILHPQYAELCARFGQAPVLHRKQWEFAFIYHHLREQGCLQPGSRGLGFGVGTEPLPAAFAAAGCEIVATDAPPAISIKSGWRETNQHAMSLDDLTNSGLCDPADFAERVTMQVADMNDIGNDLTGFDFTWSACCFEHLGSIQHGLDFVLNSIEQCLVPGDPRQRDCQTSGVTGLAHCCCW
jgi:hypothetical protein